MEKEREQTAIRGFLGAHEKKGQWNRIKNMNLRKC